MSIESLRFENLGDGRTRLTGHSTVPSQEAQDGIVESGMGQGFTEGLERLAAVVAGLRIK